MFIGYHLNNIKCPVERVFFNLSEFNLTENYVGFYYHPYYFCVITKDRNTKDIIETTIHELSHILINEDKEHFCKEVRTQ